ncbi:MAG TPA: DUF433 domain-containing protein [Pirellulales bacterium]
MSTILDNLEEQLAPLTPGEKAQVLQVVAQNICGLSPGIDSIPGVCGGSACITRTRIPVWLLEDLRRQGLSESGLLDAYPSLRAQDIVNAWNYVRLHRDEIDREIRENEEA